MAVLLIVILLIGVILQFFGISSKSLRLAGGLVIAYTGFRMLYPPEQSSAQQERAATQTSQNIAFTPLALPMLSGPGSISVVMAMATAVSELETFGRQIAGYVVMSVGIFYKNNSMLKRSFHCTQKRTFQSIGPKLHPGP